MNIQKKYTVQESSGHFEVKMTGADVGMLKILFHPRLEPPNVAA
jgi:hypothetical protein